ncbi:spermidine synthase SpeE [Cyanobacterium sp. HL-69]|uniref:spermine/spermidine synthase domain-containing protein n=1 Tax=unclassified Cyanobacterium TaxID=2629879 RepID=UPI00085265A6|nr:spermidine synthase [Cyanobacterium sp. IPPAS B-1200]AUC61512.1 spermidine synthase SpeE [Cyanobacterium sp. HL-69]OEJ78252.1 spermidine synthase [Cyanobacterium sp. IPPAS B-1200]
MAGSQVNADIWISEYITPYDIYVHGITNILAHKKTPYQDMSIVESGVYGKALVLDGKWQSCTGDEFLYHEALVHPAMIAHPNPENVLILGGGEGATTREVFRWTGVKKAMMVDIDGDVVEACKEHLPEMHQGSFDDPRLELVIGDAFNVLDNSEAQWDVIISDLSDPIEEGPSFQLFTQEYFAQLKGCLRDNGIVVIQAGPVAPANLHIHGRLVNTLKAVFSNVHSYFTPTCTYGSAWGFAIASEQSFDTMPNPEKIDRLLEQKTTNDFRSFDGISLLGMLQTPGYIRQAIKNETEVYTITQPPKFFGQGING